MPALALAWVLAVPGVTGAIVGARKSDQVGAWMGAGDLELSASDLAEIDEVIVETGAGTAEPPVPPPVKI